MHRRQTFLALLSIMTIVIMIVSSCSMTSSEDYALKGEKYLRERHFDKAIEYYTKAINKGGLSTKDLAIVYFNRAYAYNALRQGDTALKDLNEAIKLNKSFYQAYSNRGAAFAEKNQDERALENWDKAIELNPEYNLTYYYKACFYSHKCDASAACKWLTTALEKGYSDWNHMKADHCFDQIRDDMCYKNIVSRGKRS